MTNLKIAKEISLPLDVVTQTIAILAKRRVGKSYTMRRLAEQLLKAGQQVVLVDPKGDQWGIRSSADGKKPGFPIVILGGEHGDAPLESSAGEVVAKLVVEERVSVLLDLSQFRKHELATFMAMFLENLYRLKAQEKYRTPVMLVIDEADAVAPQRPQKGEERMLGAAEDIVRRGGQRGIGCVLVTQRSAVLNKNVLTQAQMLIVLRTIAPQDLAAMKSWIDVHGSIEEGKTLIDSLPSLPVGDAWFWSPGWPTAEGIFQRVHVLPIETFDSAATPAPGEKKIVPKNLADVDLEALKKQMSATLEKAKNDNPVALKRRIAELERELVKPKGQVNLHAPDPKVIERAVAAALKIRDKIWSDHIRRWKENRTSLANALNKIQQVVIDVDVALSVRPSDVPSEIEYASVVSSVAVVPQGGTSLEKRQHTPLPVERTRFDSEPALMNEKEIGEMNKGEREILNIIAQYPDGITTEHIAVLTGYKETSRREYLRKLIARTFVGRQGELYLATQTGIDVLGNDLKALPHGAELREHWLRTLPEGERKIFAALVEVYPDVLDRQMIMERTGYKETSAREYLRKLNARKLIDIQGATIKVDDKLF